MPFRVEVLAPVELREAVRTWAEMTARDNA
jgi:hypothetical protein